MGFTVSYQWHGFQRGEAVRLLRHDLRDVEEKNGRKSWHSNEMIRGDFTHLNRSLVYDPSVGDFVPMTSTDQAVKRFEQRIEELPNFRTLKGGRKVKVAPRKDANVLAKFVLQLDPEFTRDLRHEPGYYDSLSAEEFAKLPPAYATMTPKQREDTERYLQVMVDEVIERVGKENVVAISWHFDERNPHVHLTAVPGFEGRLSYSDFVTGGARGVAAKQAYARYHDSMRTALKAAGYDATDERLARRPHEPVQEYKARRKRERKIACQEREIDRGYTALAAQRGKQQMAELMAQNRAKSVLADAEEERSKILSEAREKAASILRLAERKVAVREAELDDLSSELASLQRELRDGLEAIAQDHQTLTKLLAEVRSIPEQQRARVVASLQSIASGARAADRVAARPIPNRPQRRSSISTFLDDDAQMPSIDYGHTDDGLSL